MLSACVFDPASGSVIANDMVLVPLASPGSQACFSSGDPCAAMIDPQMAGAMTIISSGQPAAETSSMTAHSSARPAPPPPYSSGRCTPRNPAAPSSSYSSVGSLCEVAQSTKYLCPYLPATWRTASRRSASSGEIGIMSVISGSPAAIF